MSAAGIAADRGGDGLVHGGRRLCAGDVGRDHHRAQSGHDLSRRAAAGEGRDRRGGHRRRARRRRRACEEIRRRRLLWPRTTAMRWRCAAASSPISIPKRRSTFRSRTPVEPKYDVSELDGIVPVDLKKQYRRARSDRAAGRRLRVRRVQGALRHDAGHRLCAYSRHSGRHSRQQRNSCFRKARSRPRISSSCAASAACRCCSCKTSWASWSGATTKPAASPRTAPRW